MFEEMTYEHLMEQYLSYAPEGVDTRQGSIYYDAGAGIMLIIARHYADLEIIRGMCLIQTAEGDALDARAAEYGITRLSATTAKYYAIFEGTIPELGSRFYYDLQYFILRQDDEGVYYFEAEEPGEAYNGIYAGTIAVPVNPVDGLEVSQFGEVYEHGSDAESDDSLRERVLEKINGPAANGNKQHYKTWCESIDGVGRARIFPLWNGENTVKAVLIDTVGQPCSAAKVAEVQEYIDPADKGMTTVVDGKTYVVGDGLGNGVANIGAHFTAVAADAYTLDVTFDAELTAGGTIEAATEEATEVITEYLRDLVLEASDEELILVRIALIGALLSACSTIKDYSNLRINGGTTNIEMEHEDEIPVLGSVTVS